jgi:hypothetical protein
MVKNVESEQVMKCRKNTSLIKKIICYVTPKGIEDKLIFEAHN